MIVLTQWREGGGGREGRGLRDGEVVAASQTQDLSSVAEGSSHDDGLVAKLLVVVVDLGD